MTNTPTTPPSPPTLNTWTPERVEELQKLWEEGLPTVEIGILLGVTKNSVVGKVHRLGYPKRQASSKSSTSTRESPPPSNRTPPVKKKPSPPKKEKEEPKAVVSPIPDPVKEESPQLDLPDPVARTKKKSFAESKNIQSMMLDNNPQQGGEKVERTILKPREKSKVRVDIDIKAYKKAQQKKADRKGTQLDNIKSSQCHWPIGDPEDYEFHFCGESSHADSPYCKLHMEEAYQKNSK